MERLRIAGPLPILLGVLHLLALAVASVAVVGTEKLYIQSSAGAAGRSLAWASVLAVAGIGVVLLVVAVVYFLRGRAFPWAVLGTFGLSVGGVILLFVKEGLAALPILPVALLVLIPVAACVRLYVAIRRGEGRAVAPTFWLGLYTLVVFLLIGLLATLSAAEDLKKGTPTFAGMMALSIFVGVTAWIGWSAFVFLSGSMRSFAYLLPCVLLALVPAAFFGFLVYKEGRGSTDAYIFLAFGVFFVLWAVLLLMPLRRRSAIAPADEELSRSVALFRVPVLSAFVFVLGGGLGAVVLLHFYGVSQKPIAAQRVTYATNGSRSQAGRAETICWPAGMRTGGLAQASVSFAQGTSVVGFRAAGQSGVDVEFEFPNGTRRRLNVGERGGRLLWPETELTGLRLRVFAPSTSNRFCLEKGQFLQKAPLLRP